MFWFILALIIFLMSPKLALIILVFGICIALLGPFLGTLLALIILLILSNQ